MLTTPAEDPGAARSANPPKEIRAATLAGISSSVVTGRRIWMALGVGLIGSQAGHLVAYQVRFGAAAQQLQSSGSHAYFPGLVRSSLGVAAVIALTGMFVIGLARILSGRPLRRRSAPDYLRLVAVLYTVQLATFAGQEVVESLLAGAPVASPGHLLLWGTLGQLPVALVAAAGLRWLLIRFDSALREIRIALATAPRQRSWAAIAVPFWNQASNQLILRSVAGASLVKRGPPSSLRVSFN